MARRESPSKAGKRPMCRFCFQLVQVVTLRGVTTMMDPGTTTIHRCEQQPPPPASDGDADDGE